jgi:outer membrane immunogenic protein
MVKRIIVLLGCGALIATPAWAADFSGARAEIRGGWDKTSLDVSFDDGVDRLSGHGSKSGFNLGAEVGYDALLSPTIIAGAYAGIEGATTKDCSEVIGNDSACLKLGRNFTVGARLGARLSPIAMLYVKGGYSNGQLRATYDNSDDPTLNFSEHVNRGGFHVGAGAQVAVGHAGYIRAEFVHTNYSGYHASDPDFSGSIDGHRDQGILGFGVQFK